MNEALNNSVARVAPKNRTYCQSLSLPARVAIVAGVANKSFGNFWKYLIETGFGITLSSLQKDYLKKKIYQRHKMYQKKSNVKLR